MGMIRMIGIEVGFDILVREGYENLGYGNSHGTGRKSMGEAMSISDSLITSKHKSQAQHFCLA